MLPLLTVVSTIHQDLKRLNPLSRKIVRLHPLSRKKVRLQFNPPIYYPYLLNIVIEDDNSRPTPDRGYSPSPAGFSDEESKTRS